MGWQELQRDQPVERQVARQVDLTHASAAKMSEDLVVADGLLRGPCAGGEDL